jgi:hypothetical protein
MLFVGPAAVTRSRRRDAVQRRIDSVKQELSQGDMSNPPERVPVSTDCNPTGVPLTYAHIITYYLAFLTDLAETSLEQSWKLTRHVARRFALPSWERERLKWGEDLLRHYLARAQIVGDVFRGRWNAGVPLDEVKAVVDATAALSDDNLPLESIILDGVQEPVAAGASRLRAMGKRGMVMVIDVGAGTADFALFVTAEDPGTGVVRARQIETGVRNNLRHASGDTLERVALNHRGSLRECSGPVGRTWAPSPLARGVLREDRLEDRP